MRLLSYHGADGLRIGLLRDGRVVDVAPVLERAGIARLPDMNAYIEAGPAFWSEARAALSAAESSSGVPLAEVRLAAPFLPKTIICGGANFYDHIDETHRAIPDHVEFFLKSPTTVIAAGEEVRMDPHLSRKYDYECELGIVIGEPTRNISRERALDTVFGYTIFNDVSIRDQQIIPWDEGRFQIRFGEGKSYLTAGSLGPWLVTTDELRDVSGLGLRTRVNGVLRQNNSMRNIIWDVPSLISYYSTYMTLEPGFLVISGTPGGPALGSDIELGADPYKRQDGVERGGYVPDGALVECEIDGIGSLANRYVISRS